MCGCIRILRRSGLLFIIRFVFVFISFFIFLGIFDRRLFSSVFVFILDVDEFEYLDIILYFVGCVGCSENCVFTVIGLRVGTCSVWELDVNKNSFKEIKLMMCDN